MLATFQQGQFGRRIVRVGAIWNPADKAASITLSNNNKTATQAAGGDTNGIVRANITKTSGKFYWEVVDTNSSSQDGIGRAMGIGVANTTESVNNFVGSTTNSWGWLGPGGNAANASVLYHNAVILVTTTALNFVTSNVLMFAFDIGAGKLWVGKGGTWYNSGNPEAGTNASFSGIGAGTYAPAATTFRATFAFTLRQPVEHTHFALSTFQNGWY